MYLVDVLCLLELFHYNCSGYHPISSVFTKVFYNLHYFSFLFFFFNFFCSFSILVVTYCLCETLRQMTKNFGWWYKSATKTLNPERKRAIP